MARWNVGTLNTRCDVEQTKGTRQLPSVCGRRVRCRVNRVLAASCAPPAHNPHPVSHRLHRLIPALAPSWPSRHACKQTEKRERGALEMKRERGALEIALTLPPLC
jgi:hypothetical protein